MNKEKASSKPWAKPEIKRLGVIADVAGNQAPGPQGNGAKT